MTWITEFVESCGVKGGVMDLDTVAEGDLVMETLVEEVSIDGMCGVY